MKAIRRIQALLLAAALFMLVPAASAYAAGSRYHPPAVTFVVMNAPKDLSLTLKLIKEGEPVYAKLDTERRAWESYYRLYRDAVWKIDRWYGNQYDLKDAVLIVESGGTEKTIPVPSEQLSERELNDYLVLDLKRGSLSFGLPFWRAPLLILMRMAVTILAECLIFYLYGYRMRRSWKIFLAVNLVTSLALNIMIRNWLNVNQQYFLGYAYALLLLPVGEIVAYVLLLDEQSRDRCINCTLWGNIASALLHIVMVTTLPL